MADTATIQQRITEVEAAIHALMTGTRAVEVQVADQRTRFSEVDMPKLREYLTWLQQQLCTVQSGYKRRPIFVEFGR